MLVLTRKTDEAIILKLPTGEQIDIIVNRFKRNQLSIGIDADEEVEIVREELLYHLSDRVFNDRLSKIDDPKNIN